MKIELIRDTFTDKSTTGRLLIDGQFFCYTLEDKDRELEKYPDRKIKGETAIPLGTYAIEFKYSPTFSPKWGNEKMAYLNGIPNYSNVLIHWGNTAADTAGCILVGRTRAKDFIGQSKDAFNALHKVLKKAWDAGEKIEIIISRAGETA